MTAMQAKTTTESAVGELAQKLARYGMITTCDIYDVAHRCGMSEEDIFSAWDRSGQKGKWEYGVFK